MCWPLEKGPNLEPWQTHLQAASVTCSIIVCCLGMAREVLYCCEGLQEACECAYAHECIGPKAVIPGEPDLGAAQE